MSKHSIPGLGASEGQKAGSFTIFPKGEYLMKVQAITINKKEDMATKKLVGQTFVVQSIVENCEKLPANEDKRDYIGKSFTDFIFVMTPDHPSYNNDTTSGKVGMIGVDTLKSFLTASNNPIKGDAFNEQKSVGAYVEMSIGVRKRKDQDGNMVDANRVWEYRVANIGGSEEEIADGESFEDDLIEE